MQPASKDSPTEKARPQVAAILIHALAEELVLSSTTRDFSGTVPNFHSLHKLFAGQYRQLGQWLDQLATRMWSVGGTPGAKMEALATARCMEMPERMPPRTMLGELMALHEDLARRLRGDSETCAAELGDPGTADILSRLVEFHETTAWMLRTLLETPEVA